MPGSLSHQHYPEEPGGDVCGCGMIICPDTNLAVVYNPTSDSLPSYWHLDGSTCFMHQVPVDCDAELVLGWAEWIEFSLDDDPEYKPETYPEWLQSQIDNHEQIRREEPRKCDLTEAYLVTLRTEAAKFPAQ